MSDYTIKDENRDRETGELQSFLLIWDDKPPEMKTASPENYLLYVEGLYDFLSGDKAVILSENPKIIVAPTNREHSYIISVDGETIETTPSEAERVLQGVMDVVDQGDTSTITDVHADLLSSQVRRKLIDAAYHTFSESEQSRIERAPNGWLIDGYYHVDWSANIYARDGGDTAYERGGGGVVETDQSKELVQVGFPEIPEPMEISVGDDTYTFTDREMLFLKKVKFILHRTDYHSDMPFWRHLDVKNDAIPQSEVDE